MLKEIQSELNYAKLQMLIAGYRWSSARFHTGVIKKDLLIKSKYEGVCAQKEWKKFLISEPIGINVRKINFRTGRPLGTDEFLKQAEIQTGRKLFPKKPGRPQKNGYGVR